MKNLKVRAKMFTGFIVVTIIGTLLGVIGIASIFMIKSASEDIAELQHVASGASGVLNAHYSWRHNLTEAVLAGKDFTGSVDPATCALGRWLGSEDAKSIDDSRILELLRQIDAPHNYIHVESRRVVDHLQAGRLEEARAVVVDNILPRTQEVITLLTEIEERFDVLIDDGNDGILSLEMTFIYLIVAIIAVAAAVSMMLAFYISNLITKPLGPLNAFMSKAGTTGDIRLGPEDKEVIGKYSQIKDEIGQTIANSAAFVGHVTHISEELAKIAGGDLTTTIRTLSAGDVLGTGLQKMVDNLNKMFGEINNSTVQVSAGSKQIADGSQSLAQGSTEQAAAVEQLSSSISEIAQKTKDNADKAMQAATLAKTIKVSAEKGSGQMDEMMAAVREIEEASQNISKVIKSIDDIAFQTNILALNAAVEAARAGQHGKGFAVVAEEVRNLASKSADAAKETGVMIQNSVDKAELGSRIAGDTAASLAEIVSGINESTQLVTEIAQSSEEQAEGIKQINQGIDQVAQVVQQNSATAEESAAASEEMSGQANLLEDLIAQFKLKDGRRAAGNAALGAGRGGGAAKTIAMPEKTYKPAGGGDYGKY